MKSNTKNLAVVVPVASVPVVLKPVPNVIVKLETPDVRIIKLHLIPALGTVVVKVAVAVGVTCTLKFDAKAMAVAPLARTTNALSRYPSMASIASFEFVCCVECAGAFKESVGVGLTKLSTVTGKFVAIQIPLAWDTSDTNGATSYIL